MIIAGDVGGTKVHLAVFAKARECVYEQKYRSRDFAEFSLLLREFMKEISQHEIKAMCLGIAGAVQNGRCHATNLPWVIDADQLQKQFSIPCVELINDLEANAWGLRMLMPHELHCLNSGKEMKGNQALIAAGTGLGEAGLYWDGKRHIPFASEGGHADFAPTNDEEIALLQHLKKQFDHVSCERVLSGAGIFRLYQFLGGENPQVKETRDEPQRLIVQKALDKSCPTCVRAMRLFVSIYGVEAGNLALKMLARSGVFIGGGIAPAILDFLKEGEFMQAFVSKGRFKEWLSEIPVHVILNDQTALLGAAAYAQQRC